MNISSDNPSSVALEPKHRKDKIQTFLHEVFLSTYYFFMTNLHTFNSVSKENDQFLSLLNAWPDKTYEKSNYNEISVQWNQICFYHSFLINLLNSWLIYLPLNQHPQGMDLFLSLIQLYLIQRSTPVSNKLSDFPHLEVPKRKLLTNIICKFITTGLWLVIAINIVKRTVYLCNSHFIELQSIWLSFGSFIPGILYWNTINSALKNIF